ncbi:hypothetical protein GIB67_015038 [Kingdonia uniflora]|uniref:Uncharacterized protein n=1 Tax=Kingdonia uniflora TaxID=39325 RepID=A0A7J7NVL4_9MAGN|nr:hypothetical protein GIB67_015038 [Kingdonia uniflora]
MPIALENNSNRIQRLGFTRGGLSCITMFNSSESVTVNMAGDQMVPMMKKSKTPVEEESDSCSSSSIGKNSDVSGVSDGGGGDDDENEVQSSYKGPLDTMDALEEVLPIKKGISRFYSGKSKSFTSLADASSSSSLKDIVKPENAYTRKRKNLLAFTLLEKNRNLPLRPNVGKRSTNFSRSTVNLAAMSSSDSENKYTGENSVPVSLSPPRMRPPYIHNLKLLHPNELSLLGDPSL